MKKDFISLFDVSEKEINTLFEKTFRIKDALKKGTQERIFADKTLAMIFEKPSLRTRVTFETGMTQLGGHAIYLGPNDIQMGKRETVADVAKNLSRWVDLIMARVFAHKTVEDLSKTSTIPVINGLSDLEHPCQIMCDLFTILEKKKTLSGITIAYVGDGNNVCNSFVAASSKLDFTLKIATPKGYEPNEHYIIQSRNVQLFHDPRKAVAGADIIYTDVWTSMGQENETAMRRKIFHPYQVNATLLDNTGNEYLLMHCLPAHRGEEITDEVLNSPRSIVLDQAENRLHTQKAIMTWLLEQS